MKRIRTFLAIATGLLCLVGCQTGTLPDPNDPKDVGALEPEEVRRNLLATAGFLNERQFKGEISAAQARALIAKRANELIKDIDLEKDPKRAWEYGEIFIAAERWELAKAALEVAVRKPVDEDRRVNDNLRLARVLAELGDIPKAIKYARSTFNCPDREAAPILPAVLLEIVPAGRGKGHDAELANLLLDSIPHEQRVIVDPASDAGKAFLFARPHHILHAYQLAIAMLMDSGHPDMASKAQKAFDSWRETLHLQPKLSEAEAPAPANNPPEQEVSRKRFGG